MSGEAKLRRKSADQTDQSNGDLNHSQSKEESNGDTRHKNGADRSKHNGDTHESNGHMASKPVKVAKSGLLTKLVVFLMLGFFFIATSIYLVVEYKDGPVAVNLQIRTVGAVIDSTICKEYAEVLIHHINDDLAPLVDSVKDSIREVIEKFTGQNLTGKVEDMEKSKDIKEDSSSEEGKNEKVRIETKEQAGESKFEKNSENIRDNIMEETIEVRRTEPIQQGSIKQKEDGKEKEVQKEPTIKVAQEKSKVEKFEDKSATVTETEKELRKETNEKDSLKTKENGKILEAGKEAVIKVAKDELKLKEAEDKKSKEESKLTEKVAIRSYKKAIKKLRKETTNDESKLKDATSNLAKDELKKKEAEEKQQRKLEKTMKEEAEEKCQKKESKNMNNAKEEVPKEKLKEAANKGKTKK